LDYIKDMRPAIYFNNQKKSLHITFNPKILLHLSYNKNDINGSVTFHKSKLHYHLPQSAAKFCVQRSFHHFHSMFQQFNPSIRSTLHWVTLPFVNG